MIRTVSALCLAALLGLSSAAAQDRNPLERERPAPPAVDEPAWVGVFVDDSGAMWVIMSGDVPTFPLVARVVTDGKPVMELTRIE